MNDVTILLAVGPAVVLIPLVLAGAAIAGLFKIFKRKQTPAPEPGEVAAAPFLDMAAGSTTAHLERKGNTWQWSLAGAATTASSDSDPGKAALAMSESLVTAEEDSPLTGSIGGPDVTTHLFGVQPDNADGWDWTITTPSKLPAIGNKPAPPTLVSSGTEDSQGLALVRALAALSKVIPWLNVQDPGGGKVGTTAPIVKPGIIISGNTVAITDLATWVAFAAPKMREVLATGATADEIMDSVVADLPEVATFNGKPIADVRKNVARVLDNVRSDSYLMTVSPDQDLAAFLVGAELRPTAWRVSQYHGYVILVRPVQVGQPHMGDAEYLIWEGGSRGYDDEAEKRGVMPTGKTLTQAERWAKQQIEQAVNAGGDFPGGGEAGGNQSADAKGPITPVDAVFIPPPVSSEAYQPATKHIELGPTMWTKSNHKDVEIFDFKDKKFYTFKHWRITVGVCLRPIDSKSPFGVLSTWLDANEGAFGGLTADQANKVKIRNAADPGFIGDGPPVVWSLFNKPLLWKGQFDGWVHAGPTLGVDPFANVTGTGAGEQVDPCEGDEAHWPTPSNPEIGFYVQPIGSLNFLQWHATPTVELITRGTKVIARITYRGFPAFLEGGGVAQAGSATTKFKLDVKIWAAGTNEDQ